MTSRADVHYVIAEHGVAHLFGKSLRFVRSVRNHVERKARAVVPVARSALADGRLSAASRWYVEEVYGQQGDPGGWSPWWMPWARRRTHAGVFLPAGEFPPG